MQGINQSLNIVICENADEATTKGYIYGPPMKALNITEVVVVRKGTEGGRPTVDFILKDEEGNEYVTMITGRLLKGIPCGE